MSTNSNQTPLSGMLGESVKVRRVRGTVIATGRPKRRAGKVTLKRIAAREKFTEAARYASGQVKKAQAKELYAKGIAGKKKNAFLVAVNDYMYAPKVSFLDTSEYDGTIGSPILIKAVDDFMVTKVKVTITNASGATIEEGEAVQDTDKDHLWEYKATAANPMLPGTTVKAIAFDRPANKGTAEVKL